MSVYCPPSEGSPSSFLHGAAGIPIIRTGAVCGQNNHVIGLDLTNLTSSCIYFTSLVNGADAADAAHANIEAMWTCVRY